MNSTGQILKPLFSVAVVAVVAALLARLVVESFMAGMPYQGVVESVLTLLFSMVLALPLLLVFFRPYQAFLQQLKSGQPLDGKGNALLQEFARHYNQLSNKFKQSVAELGRVTSELSSTASTLSGFTDKTNRNILQQQQETDMVATAMNEMSTTVEEVARNASEAASAAEQANSSATAGERIAHESKSSIDSLVSDIQNASDVIAQLEKQSAEITVVLEVIKGIAEQTNLLALNAAIEAARAGEQGRGFAVVADEVRSLANRTQESAQEIDEMIGSLQDGVRSSVAVMESASSRGNESSEKVENTLSALQDITQAVNVINDMNAQIATAAEEQSQVANEINQNIVGITQTAETTIQHAQEAQQTSMNIADISEKLTELVRQLDTGGSSALDLSAAKAAHLNWKSRLRAFLDGKATLSMEEAVSHRDCKFGKWYYSDGLRDFSHLHGIQAVEKPHEELHELIRVIIDLKNNGRIAEAEEAYRQVDSISSTIVNYLDEAEREVAG